MSIEQKILSFKDLCKLIRDKKRERTGVICYAPGSDFFEEIMAAVGHNPSFIVQEIVAKGVKHVVNEDAKFNFFSSQADFVGFGEKWIKLPEKMTVQVRQASLDHMRIEDQNLLDNHMKQLQSFLVHREKLVVPIIRTMEQQNLKTAGQAIELLNAK